MTRINLVHPTQLTDKHLVAEYRELPRVFTLVKKAEKDNKLPVDYDIPKEYTLGRGHVIFFYNKCAWLFRRFTSIVYELERRGFTLNTKMIDSITDSAIWISSDFWGDYNPRPEDIYLNMARITKRSKIDSVLEELKS